MQRQKDSAEADGMIRRASDAWGRKSGTYLLTVDEDLFAFLGSPLDSFAEVG